MPSRQPAAANLAEALRWMVAHSQASTDELIPGPLELAEVLWLAWQLPEQPRREGVRQSRPSKPADSELRTSRPTVLPDPPRHETRPPGPALPPDPFLPTPFPGDSAQPSLDEPLLPVAVLPDEHDIARELAGMVLAGRVQEEAPLGDRGKLLRALAPLLRRRPDPQRQRFDEERTVELFAQTGLLLPVFQPSQGPAFDEVLLLRDGGVSMQVWQRQAEELRRVLASTQMFPRVRLQELQPGPVVRFQDPAAHRQAVEQLSGAARLLQGSRSLLLLLSDTAGRHWWDGRMFAVLEHWGRACPTAILQPLPIWHWSRTALAAVERVSVRNSSAAAANPAYGADRLNWWEEPLPTGRDLPLPVLPLDRQALGTWSAMVMGNPAYATAGVVLPPQQLLQQRLRQLLGDRDLSAPSQAPASLTADEAAARWEVFQAMASPQAQQLLRVMSSSPLLTLPVIGLLKMARLTEVSGSLPIAEVLTSGLVVRKLERRKQAREPRKDSAQPLRPEQIQFEVLPEVAALLRSELPATERRDVISRVSALVERRWNRQFGEPSFEAVLCDPTVSPPEHLKEGIVQFASVTARLLDTLPGEAARAFAERIRKGSSLPPGSPWPATMAFEAHTFSTAQLLDTPELESEDFTAARWHELFLQQVEFQTLRPADLAAFLGQVEKEGGAAARASLPTATAWAFHEPLQRDARPPGATAEAAGPLTLTLVEIPAGSFLMGSPPEEPERSDDEGPQHEVKLASFFMSHTPITQAQWREVAGWQPLPAERWGQDLNPDPSHFQNREGQAEGEVRLFEAEANTDNRPVENVSWLDAMEFCNRLSQRTGRTYSLPSEAQWEYACRAGTTTPFHFGDTISPELANYRGDVAYADGPQGVYREQTTPVAMFPANAWGLHDMHANVWEWCLDEWHDSYEGAPTDGRAWVDAAEGEKSKESVKTNLLRGGSWISDPRNCRSAYRIHLRPVDADSSVGFRVVCLPQDPSLNP
jgi:formylglycine-generating enzyme required for sulfatase activity